MDGGDGSLSTGEVCEYIIPTWYGDVKFCVFRLLESTAVVIFWYLSVSLSIVSLFCSVDGGTTL